MHSDHAQRTHENLAVPFLMRGEARAFGELVTELTRLLPNLTPRTYGRAGTLRL